MKKICARCNESKGVSEFNFKNKLAERRHNWCRLCQSAYKAAHYQQNKVKYVTKAASRNKRYRELLRGKVYDYLSVHPCVDCGESDPVVLEFDHVRENKEWDIAKMLTQAYSWDTVLKEIAKCDVRCANCHKRRTAKQFGYYSYLRRRRQNDSASNAKRRASGFSSRA
jgi:hypothetical protein